MKVESRCGQITVFLSIVLLSVIVLVGVLIDVSRISAGQTQVRRAVASSARSALAQYNTRLKNEFGIFALGISDENRLKEVITGYIAKNLISVYGAGNENITKGRINLYDYRVESLSVTPVFNLSENKAVKNQILEYMKYRAPKEIIEGVWDKLSAVNNASKMSEAFKRKTRVDKLAGRISRSQESLKKNLDGRNGDGRDKGFAVNLFNLNGSLDGLISNYAGLVSQYKSLLNKLRGFDDYDPERSEVLDSLNLTERNLRSVADTIRESHIQAFIKPNEGAAENLNSILRLGIETTAANSDLKGYLEENFPGGSSQEFGDDFKAVMKDDVEKIEELIPGEEEVRKMVDCLSGNSSVLRNTLNIFDTIDGRVRGLNPDNPESFEGLEADEIIRTLSNMVSGYKKLEYDYKRVKKSAGYQDTRKERESEAREKLRTEDKKNKDINIIESGISLQELPSRKKVESREPVEAGEGAAYGEAGYDGNLSELDTAIEFNQNGNFSEKAFGFISSMGGILGKGLKDLRDEIYVDEYIIGTFKNAVPSVKGAGGDEKDRDFRGVNKEERQSFFNCEVEYILHGNPSQNVNKLMTKGQILLIRFGLDTLHVYTDAEKRHLAEGAAAAVAGWWTGGIGVPVFSNLIMCGWGMGEAVKDLDHLMSGEAVPFYKSKGDWELDIGLTKNAAPKSGRRLAFSYYDYLRLLLLIQNPDEKINRLEDLVELDMQKTKKQFKMAGSSTYIRVEAVVSMKYLFLSRLFIPEGVRTRDKRHVFRTVIYEGY